MRDTGRVPNIRIFVDGRLALTTAQAALRHGRSHAVMRMLIHRLGVKPVAHIDGRTPVYGAVALDKAVKAPPHSRS
jgi:hypothetical protein